MKKLAGWLYEISGKNALFPTQMDLKSGRGIEMSIVVRPKDTLKIGDSRRYQWTGGQFIKL